MNRKKPDPFPLQARLRELRAEVDRLGKSASTSSSRLRLLLLKKDIVDVLKLLKREQARIGEKQSEQLAASRGASTYARMGQLKKTSR